MSDPFELDPRLAADTFVVGETPLNQVLLMNDARYPWLILVPRRCDITEPFELSEADQAQLWQDSMRLGEAMKARFAADKLNIAALGCSVIPPRVEAFFPLRPEVFAERFPCTAGLLHQRQLHREKATASRCSFCCRCRSSQQKVRGFIRVDDNPFIRATH